MTRTSPDRSPGPGADPSARPGPEPKPVSPGRRKLRPDILSVPAVAVVIGILYPFFVGVFYAFLNYSAINQNPVLVGFANFTAVLSSSEFWHSVQVTVVLHSFVALVTESSVMVM